MSILQQLQEMLTYQHPRLEAVEYPSPQDTLYAAVLPAPGAKNVLNRLLGDADLTISKTNDLHITVVYSRECTHPNPDMLINHNDIFEVAPLQFEIFMVDDNDNESEKAPLLVLRIDSDDLQREHQYLLDQIEGTHDFPSYNPHVTIGMLDDVIGTAHDWSTHDELLEKLNRILTDRGYTKSSLVWTNLYQEPLDVEKVAGE